jgi:uncharacterized protein YjbJ (UPF0337 family)
MNAQFLKYHWTVIKPTLKQNYPDLTDNDLAYISGCEEEVFGRVEQRTGVKREQLEGFLQSAIDLDFGRPQPAQMG